MVAKVDANVERLVDIKDELLAKRVETASEGNHLSLSDIAVITGRTRYFEPEASYRNLFVIRFADDDRCYDFTEWYIEEDT